MNNDEVLMWILKIVAMFIVPLAFMLIWNEIMPILCGFNTITYWQSFLLGIGVRLINGSIAIRSKLN